MLREKESRERLTRLQERVGYYFHDPELLRRAMMHSSYTNEHGMERLECNERLEFLGDAVLELASSEFLYVNYPGYPEGEMTKLRASIVCEPTLADCAEALGLRECLLLGKGEEATGGRTRPSITSDALEALIGAIYLDGGFASAKEFVWKYIMNDIENRKLFYDSKTILQEMVQERELGELTYRLLKTEGPDHCKVFTSQVLIDGAPRGVGSGHNKKLAEQAAAYQAIRRLKEGGACI
ncbi:MAG: ribonuclease III [Lachnospiraceae bacterium]|nr:ribonuclease III [Lachnospiraceae bacterium]